VRGRELTLFALVALGACKARSGAASFDEVPVVAPFDALELPTTGGVVWQCNAARMKILYDGGDQAALGDRYARAVEQHGWSADQPGASSSHQWIERFRKGPSMLTLDVHDADFRGRVPNGVEVFLSIEDAPK